MSRAFAAAKTFSRRKVPGLPAFSGSATTTRGSPRSPRESVEDMTSTGTTRQRGSSLDVEEAEANELLKTDAKVAAKNDSSGVSSAGLKVLARFRGVL